MCDHYIFLDNKMASCVFWNLRGGRGPALELSWHLHRVRRGIPAPLSLTAILQMCVL